MAKGDIRKARARASFKAFMARRNARRMGASGAKIDQAGKRAGKTTFNQVMRQQRIASKRASTTQ